MRNSEFRNKKKEFFLPFCRMTLSVLTVLGALGLSSCASPQRDTASQKQGADTEESCRETFPRGMNGPARIVCDSSS